MLRLYACFARTFIDDIVIFSDIAEDYLRDLDVVFKTFSYKNIAILLIKSFISYPSVELLRFYINLFSLTTTSKKIAAFKQLAFLATLKALEYYISATSFL